VVGKKTTLVMFSGQNLITVQQILELQVQHTNSARTDQL